MSYHITLIGAVGDEFVYDRQAIIELLDSQQTHLLHGDTFTGRPGTQIHKNENTVLKIRNELRLEAFSAKRWANHTLEKERQYQIYHPHKTWFVAEKEGNPIAIIGNICPRLQPLHDLFSQNKLSESSRLDYLGQLFGHYFRLANTRGIRLDEGLSNFGVTEKGIVYYLDDDIYNWDRFISCAQMLGVYFRSLPWLTGEIAVQLGQLIHQLILDFFQDAHYFTVLAEQLRDVYLPTVSQRQGLQGFISALDLSQPVTHKSSNLPGHRYLAILADVHANLPALEVVLNFLRIKNISQGIVLGDIVGYGPHPSQCIQRLMETELVILKGNHDHGLATGNFKKGFSSTASWVLEWSDQRINIEQKNWLLELPPVLHSEQWMGLHGAPIDPTFFNAYVYEMTYQDNLTVLQRKNIPVCFHGHTHQPGIYGRKKIVDGHHQADEIDLSRFSHVLACPGSVGQPRNGRVGAQFAIFDQKERKLYFHTLSYDLVKIVQEMEQEGFPATLINVLKGRGRQ